METAETAPAVKPAPNKERPLSPQEREDMIRYLMWDFDVEGIHLTREQAEEAVDKAFSDPLLEL